jgi:hypothetical protein
MGTDLTDLDGYRIRIPSDTSMDPNFKIRRSVYPYPRILGSGYVTD